MTSSSLLAYTPAEALLFDVHIVSYVLTCNFAVYAYDLLLSLPDEVEIVARCGFSWSIVIYFLSRITQFANALFFVVVTSAPLENCELLVSFGGPIMALPVLSTAFLFFLRVRAVYLKSRRITAIFCSLWLVLVMLEILVSASLRTARIPDSRSCMYKADKYVTPLSISLFVYDTIIFLAISYRLAADTMPGGSWRARFLSVVKGKGLHTLSRSLLQSGQLYYLSTILFFLANQAVQVSPHVPPVLHDILVKVYVGFTNIMACRVFRGVALGHWDDHASGVSQIDAAIDAALEMDMWAQSEIT